MRIAGGFIAVGILLPVIFFHELWAWFFGMFISIACFLTTLNMYQFYRNKQPQIIVSDKGIQTSKIPFYPWRDIKGEDVVEISEGKTTGYYLIYDCPRGHMKHALSFLDTNYGDLSGILKMYRGKQDELLGVNQ